MRPLASTPSNIRKESVFSEASHISTVFARFSGLSSPSLTRCVSRGNTLAKRQEIDEEERLVMGHQLEQLDQWVHQLAAKIGVELSV